MTCIVPIAQGRPSPTPSAHPPSKHNGVILLRAWCGSGSVSNRSRDAHTTQPLQKRRLVEGGRGGAPSRADGTSVTGRWSYTLAVHDFENFYEIFCDWPRM